MIFNATLNVVDAVAPVMSSYDTPAYEKLIPIAPNTIDETGISVSTVEQLVLKALYFRGDLIGRELAGSLGFKFSVIDDLLENLKRHTLVQVRRSLGMGNMSAYFALTEAGRTHARQHLESSQYAGPAP